ncbi:hypothetical protein [Nocardioides pacificus]
MSTGTKGKRAGARRAAAEPRKKRGLLMLLALGITLTIIAWGYLVSAAIDFGSTARGGDAGAWGFLILASFGAIVCLFTALLLGSRVLRELGITRPPDERPRPTGGRRAAR